MITVKIGDLFEGNAKTLVNTVNCVGVMGKGIAQLFKKRYPEMFADYQARCERNEVLPGVPYLYKDMFGASILNFPTKKHWRSPALLKDVIQGLDIFIEKYQEWSIESIAFPPLGCGNGGLEWEVVGPIMYQKLSQLNIPIEIYAPYGTPARLLTEEFLNEKNEMPNDLNGRKGKALKPSWIALLEVVSQLEKRPYANPIGRTIFQKICYIMTEQGVETGFNYAKGSYGPFSQEVNEAINVLANANLLKEKQLGRMTAVGVGSEFLKTREKYLEQITNIQKKINKTVDLFSRIRSTEQAEEVATVLYAARQLKQDRANEEVSEQDLYDYILSWKKAWNTADKQKVLASTIRNLEMLSWLKLKYSDTLPDAADEPDLDAVIKCESKKMIKGH